MITDIQYDHLKRIGELIAELGRIKVPDDWDEDKRTERIDNYNKCRSLLSNIISSYEHFREKREGIENEKNGK